MKKYLWIPLAAFFVTACSSDDIDITEPAPETEQQIDYRDTLSEWSKEAARRLVGTWKEVYSYGWTPNSLKEVDTNDYNYLTFYEDGRMEWCSDFLPWDSTYEAKVLLKEWGYKAFGYRVSNDWKYDEKNQILSGNIGYNVIVDLDNNLIGEGDRYYLQFGGADQYELYIIEAPIDRINCYGYGRGYIRVE